MSAVGMRETKLRILERLRSRPSCAAELAAELGISRVAIHRHLEELKQKKTNKHKQHPTNHTT
jgi:biotin operon repressor